MIVADTHSTFSNFAPNEHDDPSLRTFTKPVFLIPPFTLVSGYDLHACNYLQKCLNIQKSETGWIDFLISRDTDPTDLVSLGSSLWQSCFLSAKIANDEGALKSTVTYAILKLTCGHFSDWKPEAYLAMILARVHVGILPKSRVANQLVARSMAQLDYLPLDRSTAFISYPSDPILAEGAKRCIMQKPTECLRTLLNYTCDSTVDLGDGGEFAAQIKLLSAFDSLKSGLKSVTVYEG
jgi:hypothetical protein